MEEELVSVEEGNRGTRTRVKGLTHREIKSSQRYGDPGMIHFKRPCHHNGKSFKCDFIKISDIVILRRIFYEDSIKINQDIKLCHMLSVSPVQRRKSDITDPLKQLSISYFIKTGNTATRVCFKFFSAAIGITKHRINTVAKVLLKGGVPKENRGGDRVSYKTESKKDLLRTFIKRLRGRESHYNRKKSKRIYLSASLSVARLHKMFNKENEPENRVSYYMFRKIFQREFNIGFSSPASDVCSTCTRLKQQYKMETKDDKRRQLAMEYRVHRKRASTFYALGKEIPNNSITFCFDLQQVQPLPRTPIGEAFYAHQISLYAFCCVGMSSQNPKFYVWTEDLAGRGSTEVGSALLNHLDTLDYTDVNKIRLFCDGCAGQNKNSHIVHTLMFWLKHKSPKHVSEITLTFPVRGHSFMAADRCFGRVEKLLRKNPVIISKEEYIRLYTEVGDVKSLGLDWEINDIKKLEEVYKKVKAISEAKRISIKKYWNKKVRKTEIKVGTYAYYRFDTKKDVRESLLKKGKADDNIRLQRTEFKNCLPEKKKPSLRHLMKEHFGDNWESRQDLEWYRSLLSMTEETTENNNAESSFAEQCDCLDEEPSIHI